MGGADRIRGGSCSGERRVFRRGDRQRQDPAWRTHRAAVDRRLYAGRMSDRPGNRPDSGARVSEMTTNQKNHGTVLITGASSGIGRELALEFGARAEMRFWRPEAGPA